MISILLIILILYTLYIGFTIYAKISEQKQGYYPSHKYALFCDFRQKYVNKITKIKIIFDVSDYL